MESPEERKARLALALRQNLKRRKAQAREQADDDAPARSERGQAPTP